MDLLFLFEDVIEAHYASCDKVENGRNFKDTEKTNGCAEKVVELSEVTENSLQSENSPDFTGNDADYILEREPPKINIVQDIILKKTSYCVSKVGKPEKEEGEKGDEKHNT